MRGMSLKRRFVLAMTAALSVVVGLASVLIYQGSLRAQQRIQQEALASAALLTQAGPEVEERGVPLKHPSGVEIYDVTYGPERERATLYRVPARMPSEQDVELFMPSTRARASRALFGVIAVIMLLVVLVGAAVALWIASNVTRPVRAIMEDVRSISLGDFQRHIRSSGGGEIALLAESIERMRLDLSEAQEAKHSLSVQSRELSLAASVREALLPVATPLVEGYDIAAVHIGSTLISGDFHDYLELADGRVGLLICDVSGQGMPAAMIGAIARSYLRSELVHIEAGAGKDALANALARANRWLVGDVRHGVFVTALYALLDPSRARLLVANAGHRMPLLRIAAADGRLRTVHPEGLALGLDRGPVFEQRLEVAEVPLEPGDRIFLGNGTPVSLKNAEGRELGEKAFFTRVLKHSSLSSLDFLRALRQDILAFAGEDGVQSDTSLVTIVRDPSPCT